MREPLSICATAMLAAIASNGTLDTGQLLEHVPWREQAVGVADVEAWFDELQRLLDYGLVCREVAPHAFVYLATDAGFAFVYGHIRCGEEIAV